MFLNWILKKFLMLYKNNLLFKDNEKIISDSTLVAITLLLAESKTEEKEIMINVIMNFLELFSLKSGLPLFSYEKVLQKYFS